MNENAAAAHRLSYSLICSFDLRPDQLRYTATYKMTTFQQQLHCINYCSGKLTLHALGYKMSTKRRP